MTTPDTEPGQSPTADVEAVGWRRTAGEVSGAFADLGTFLPLIIGMFAVQRLDPVGVFVGFGIFALVVALVYRRPVPVQPMKVVAAVVIAGGLDAAGVAATGLLLGAILCLLAVTGVVGRLARWIPDNVLAGVRLGVGLYLVWAGLGLAVQGPLPAALALAVLLALQRSRLKPLAAISVVAGGAIWGVLQDDAALPALSAGLFLPQPLLPDAAAWWAATREVLLPQLVLTLTNAAVITAAIAAELFPADRARITPDRLAWSSGGLNLLLAPFGAFPMCHGAGGLVVQHRFGARSGLAPALFGLTCLALGVLLGPNALALLALLPMAAVGALLLVAGVDLARSRRLREVAPDGLAVILCTGVVCVVLNVAGGLLIGLLAEGLRRLWIRRLDHRR